MKREYLVSALEMKQLDYNTITKTGLPSLVLMERAALAVAKRVMDYLEDNHKKSILVIAGNGNNGADGVCAGRILKEYGYTVDVCVLKSRHEYTQEMKVQMEAAAKYDIPILSETEIFFNQYEVIVDSIFGIGLNRSIEGDIKDLIEHINHSSCYVISVDIPSGVNASTGKICGTAIKADETVTFGFYKRGQIFYPGRMYCGKLWKENIAINETSFYGMKPELYAYFADNEDEKIDFPRNPMGNKGTFGKVFVIAGRESTAGAALLCAASALRSGCGMVSVLTETGNREAFLSSLPEAMMETYDDNDSESTLKDKIDRWLAWADVIVIGCGLGKDERACQILAEVINTCEKTMVCDADALQLLAEHKALRDALYQQTMLKKREVVFTPHPGELAALAHCTIADVKEERLAIAETVCKEYGAVLIAKDADTMCIKMEGEKYLNTTGNNGLSTAGSGDVLAGLTASIIAQSHRIDMSIFDAVCFAVYLHGYAADVCAKENGKRFLVASDIIEAYKYILK